MNGVITILRRSPRASLGLGILVTLVLLALLAPAFTAHSPTSQAYGTWLKLV